MKKIEEIVFWQNRQDSLKRELLRKVGDFTLTFWSKGKKEIMVVMKTRDKKGRNWGKTLHDDDCDDIPYDNSECMSRHLEKTRRRVEFFV